MKTICVPQPITVSAPPELGSSAPPEEISFLKFALLSWLDDPRAIADGFAKTVRWAEVLRTFRSATDTIELDDEDYATLRRIVESPAGRLPPTIAIQLIPFSEAVLCAKSRLKDT